MSDENAALKERIAELERENARLKAPHARDCAFLISKTRGRWDCDCDASEVDRLRAQLAQAVEALERVYRETAHTPLLTDGAIAQVCAALAAIRSGGT
jgi:hypothetical protein